MWERGTKLLRIRNEQWSGDAGAETELDSNSSRPLTYMELARVQRFGEAVRAAWAMLGDLGACWVEPPWVVDDAILLFRQLPTELLEIEFVMRIEIGF